MLSPAVATQVFSVLTIIAEVSTIVIIASLLIKTTISQRILTFFRKYGLLYAFLVALVSMLGSLYYSEIAKYTPCVLCWYQRILMYPQVFLLGIAYMKKDIHIAIYSLVLSALGAIIALYHYSLQIGLTDELIPCTTVGYSVSCAEKFDMTFGYITIPMMSLSAFTLILTLMIILRKKNK